MIKVFLVDDHTLLRQGLRKLLELESFLEIVGEAGTGDEALQKVALAQPDVILLDINMPGINGVETTKYLKKSYPEMKVLILTIHQDDEYVIEAIKAGADGYLLKDVQTEELIGAIQTAAQGINLIGDGWKERVESECQHCDQLLTQREMEVLAFLVQGYSNKSLAQELFISEKTVKNHISNIFRKLKVVDRTQAVIKALKCGLVKL